MSEKSGITHDTASRLIGVTPGELESLVRDGIIRREDKNRYTVPVLVLDYITHLREAKSKIEPRRAKSKPPPMSICQTAVSASWKEN